MPISNIDTSVRPTHVSHPVLEAIVAAMRAADRDDLVHYAGACYRDDAAWRVCLDWLAAQTGGAS
jgi:hypothetical protein